jgi:hypothetical protein
MVMAQSAITIEKEILPNFRRMIILNGDYTIVRRNEQCP